MKLLLGITILFFSQITMASTGYHIKINDSGYDLKIEMSFSSYQSLMEIRKAFTRSAVISSLSPNVLSVTNTGSPANYESLMVVKSFGIKSNLLSKCSESFTDTSWERSCTLQTDKLDGGKYMVEKRDHAVCTKLDLQNASCVFSIKGKTKPVKVLGIELVNARVFAVKAKFQALNNFFKQYYYILDHNISTAMAREKFEHSRIKIELDNFEEEASGVLKKEQSYVRHYVQKELH
jgi:hypothetical protein